MLAESLDAIGIGSTDLLGLCVVLVILGAAYGRMRWKQGAHARALKIAAAEAAELKANPRTFTLAECVTRARHAYPSACNVPPVGTLTPPPCCPSNCVRTC